METGEIESTDPAKIYGLTISQDESGCYGFSFKHEGNFRLGDYAIIEVRIKNAVLIKR